jgi:predicted nucleotidyltransferase
MDRDAAIAKLKAHEAELKRLGVQSLYLFGSTARGEARDDSDVDLFFDYEKENSGFFS